jgi:hypothetical protein
MGRIVSRARSRVWQTRDLAIAGSRAPSPPGGSCTALEVVPAEILADDASTRHVDRGKKRTMASPAYEHERTALLVIDPCDAFLFGAAAHESNGKTAESLAALRRGT